MYCPENYCCPVDSKGNLMASGDPNCQPGCNGGAQSICTATGDPVTCAFAHGGQAAVNALEGRDAPGRPRRGRSPSARRVAVTEHARLGAVDLTKQARFA